jgi:transcriptional regulator with XRE-family HTH domain
MSRHGRLKRRSHPIEPHDEITIDVGRQLVQARERRGLTLDELSRRTKISMASLRAIERNDASALPGGIYTVGFLQAYAREVGCDPRDIVGRYAGQSGGWKAENAREQPVAEDRPGGDPTRLHSGEIDTLDRRRARAHLIQSVAVLLVAGMAYYALGLTSNRASPSFDGAMALPASTSTTAIAALKEEETGTSAPGGSNDPVLPIPEALRFEMRPRRSCWVSGTADGQRVVHRLLAADERIVLEAQKDVVLRVGDAESVEFSINGAAGRRLGGVGEALTIHVTPQNYSEFLARLP